MYHIAICTLDLLPACCIEQRIIYVLQIANLKKNLLIFIIMIWNMCDAMCILQIMKIQAMWVILNQIKVNFKRTNLLGDIIANVFEDFLEGFLNVESFFASQKGLLGGTFVYWPELVHKCVMRKNYKSIYIYIRLVHVH